MNYDASDSRNFSKMYQVRHLVASPLFLSRAFKTDFSILNFFEKFQGDQCLLNLIKFELAQESLHLEYFVHALCSIRSSLKWGASSWWSFGPNSAWGSIVISKRAPLYLMKNGVYLNRVIGSCWIDCGKMQRCTAIIDLLVNQPISEWYMTTKNKNYENWMGIS